MRRSGRDAIIRDEVSTTEIDDANSIGMKFDHTNTALGLDLLKP